MKRIQVKHILEILKRCNPEATIDFYNYGTNFDEADLSQLEEYIQNDHVNICIKEKG